MYVLYCHACIYIYICTSSAVALAMIIIINYTCVYLEVNISILLYKNIICLVKHLSSLQCKHVNIFYTVHACSKYDVN